MCMGSIVGALGRLAELRNDPDAAIDRYEQAIDREERAGALIWATRHRWRLGDVLAASGRPELARALLARVRAGGRRHGDDPHRRPGSRAVGGLTPPLAYFGSEAGTSDECGSSSRAPAE